MPWITCKLGDDRGLARELAEGESLVMGRAPDCDIQLVETRSSRNHCKLVLHGGKLYVEDLGSTNGIKFNGKRYQGERIKLGLGESFLIGGDVFVFAKTNDQYLEASEDLMADVNKHSHGQVVEKSFADALSLELRRKKSQFRVLRWLLGKDKE